jgi:hypothetical protein
VEWIKDVFVAKLNQKILVCVKNVLRNVQSGLGILLMGRLPILGKSGIIPSDGRRISY